MTRFVHPLKDAEFVLQHLVQFDALTADAGLEDINLELASAIMSEAGNFGANILAPLNWIGDQQPAQAENNAVQETPGFAEAYHQFIDMGWPSLTAPEVFGGQQLPNVLGTAVNEIWQSANMAFGLCPMLSNGAIEALLHHANEALQQAYLPKLISGEWTGTMNLTEPQAGSDLAAVKTKAVPHGDHYLISGQKIFITWGDHQMTDNVIHLVLARTPEAPAGVKGISLFIVPKFILDQHGYPNTRNDVYAVSVEHKLGIHGSPTCTMNFGENGGAIGYLVGEENKGLMYMFTMMNHARQNVGVQGLGISERAYQHAVAFAKERLQSTNKDGSRDAIINFPDVRRMLIQMKASIEAMRSLALVAAAEVDRSHLSAPELREHHHARTELYTPIVKGWLTELAQEVTSLALQVFGGMGYVEETGAAQFVRDARILPIYEGTTGIQALDLVGRKTLLNGGQHLHLLLADIEQTIAELGRYPDLVCHATHLSNAVEHARTSSELLLNKANDDPSLAGSISVNFMMLCGYLVGGWLMAQSAIAASKVCNEGHVDASFMQAKLVTSQFYCEHLLTRTHSLAMAIKAGSETIMALDNDLF